MKYRPSEGATETARKLRLNPTRAETAMWRLVRECLPEARFRRQVPIRHYVVDFASHRARLVIEVDGGQHEPARDAIRTRRVEAEGYRVLRIWNSDVLGNPEGVWHAIHRALHDSHPHPALPHQGGGDK